MGHFRVQIWRKDFIGDEDVNRMVVASSAVQAAMTVLGDIGWLSAAWIVVEGQHLGADSALLREIECREGWFLYYAFASTPMKR